MKNFFAFIIFIFSFSVIATPDLLKSGFIYTEAKFDSCGYLVKTLQDNIVSLEVVSNPSSGYSCLGQDQLTFKCEGSRCISLKYTDFNSVTEKKIYPYFIISNTGNFYLNSILCETDANGMPVNCSNPTNGPSFLTATKFTSPGTPSLFKGYAWYIKDSRFSPHKNLEEATEYALREAEFKCAKFWSSCTRDHNLDRITVIDNGHQVLLFIRGH